MFVRDVVKMRICKHELQSESHTIDSSKFSERYGEVRRICAWLWKSSIHACTALLLLIRRKTKRRRVQWTHGKFKSIALVAFKGRKTTRVRIGQVEIQ